MTRQLTVSGFFIALGLILPMLFHLAGGMGVVFLPMHLPVLLAGFFLPGDSLLVTAGLLAAVDNALNIWVLIPLLSAAAIVNTGGRRMSFFSSAAGVMHAVCGAPLFPQARP